MLDMISSIENKFDVYIVAQKNDPELNEYYKYNAEVLTPDVTSIFQKIVTPVKLMNRKSGHLSRTMHD